MNRLQRLPGTGALSSESLPGSSPGWVFFFTNNRYYPDIGAPYTIGVPATAAVVFTLLAYVLIDYQ